MLAQLSHAMGLNYVCRLAAHRASWHFSASRRHPRTASPTPTWTAARSSPEGSTTTSAPARTARIAAGEIVVFDKAYVDFHHLLDVDHPCVWWATRAKDNMLFRVVKKHTKGHENIIKDQIIALKGRGCHNFCVSALR